MSGIGTLTEEAEGGAWPFNPVRTQLKVGHL